MSESTISHQPKSDMSENWMDSRSESENASRKEPTHLCRRFYGFINAVRCRCSHANCICILFYNILDIVAAIAEITLGMPQLMQKDISNIGL